MYGIGFVSLQVNARKVYDEANVLAGLLSNQLFLAILLGEASLQVRFQHTAVLCAHQWETGSACVASCNLRGVSKCRVCFRLGMTVLTATASIHLSTASTSNNDNAIVVHWLIDLSGCRL